LQRSYCNKYEGNILRKKENKMRTKYQGIIPAFYACYDKKGDISPEATEIWTQHLLDKGVKGVYVGGSSGECIYLGVEERKIMLEHVMKVAKGKMTVIAHVACNNTKDSMELAAHAQKLGVDAIAAIPPIYFHLPAYAIAQYWNDISSAAPDTDFVIYNIPQLAGVALTMPLFEEMRKNPHVVAVKNSSMPTQDIQMFKQYGGKDFVVFNGPDEQLVSGLAIGADGGIGGTYGVMPELYLAIFEDMKKGDIERARKIQNQADAIIYAMCECHGNLYAVMKEIIRRREGIDLGTVRKPLPDIIPEDNAQIEKCVQMINQAIGEL
jgi:N-acetylneuraminate lyase